jgi:predicted nucleic acid-binding protein
MQSAVWGAEAARELRGSFPPAAKRIRWESPADSEHILVDTCVWLDVAKDYQQQPILAALEELIRQGDIALILPRIVINEIVRNKERVIEDGSRSLSSTLKRAKEAVEKFGDPRKKNAILTQLNEVDYRLPTLGSAAVDTVGRIEKLFARTPVVEISDAVKLRAAQRAIDKRAPFHRQRNSIDDAILIEIYADGVTAKAAGSRFQAWRWKHAT